MSRTRFSIETHKLASVALHVVFSHKWVRPVCDVNDDDDGDDDGDEGCRSGAGHGAARSEGAREQPDGWEGRGWRRRAELEGRQECAHPVLYPDWGHASIPRICF